MIIPSSYLSRHVYHQHWEQIATQAAPAHAFRNGLVRLAAMALQALRRRGSRHGRPIQFGSTLSEPC